MSTPIVFSLLAEDTDLRQELEEGLRQFTPVHDIMPPDEQEIVRLTIDPMKDTAGKLGDAETIADYLIRFIEYRKNSGMSSNVRMGRQNDPFSTLSLDNTDEDTIRQLLRSAQG